MTGKSTINFLGFPGAVGTLILLGGHDTSGSEIPEELGTTT